MERRFEESGRGRGVAWCAPGLLLLLVARAVPAGAAPTTDEDFGGGARVAKPSPEVAARLEVLTRPLLGRPYVISPLGEGEGATPDPDPRWRDDAFDCTTFVETALALALTAGAPADADAAPRTLDRLRYAGAPRYAARRHLPEAQWVPGLEALGVIAPYTAIQPTITATLTLDAARFEKRRVARALVLDRADVPTGAWPVTYVPLAALEPQLEALPAGLLVNVVRQPVPWSPTWVTHQGLLLRDPRGRLVLRHASPISKRVVDEPFARVVHRYRTSKANKAWPIVGVQLFVITGRG